MIYKIFTKKFYNFVKGNSNTLIAYRDLIFECFYKTLTA